MSANSLLKGSNSCPLVQQRPSFVHCVTECIPIRWRVVGNTGRLKDKEETKPKRGISVTHSNTLPVLPNPESPCSLPALPCPCSQVLTFCYEKLIASAFKICTQRDQKNKRISVLSHPPALILQWIFFRKKNSSLVQSPRHLLGIATATKVINNAWMTLKQTALRNCSELLFYMYTSSQKTLAS